MSGDLSRDSRAAAGDGGGLVRCCSACCSACCIWDGESLGSGHDARTGDGGARSERNDDADDSAPVGGEDSRPRGVENREPGEATLATTSAIESVPPTAAAAAATASPGPSLCCAVRGGRGGVPSSACTSDSAVRMCGGGLRAVCGSEA